MTRLTFGLVAPSGYFLPSGFLPASGLITMPYLNGVFTSSYTRCISAGVTGAGAAASSAPPSQAIARQRARLADCDLPRKPGLVS